MLDCAELEGGFVTTRSGFFYNYMSCIEEKRYCEHPAAVVSVLRHNPVYEALVGSVAERFRVDVSDELCQPMLVTSADVDGRRMARVLQLALYVVAADEIRKRTSIDFAAGYSYGYAAAFVQAKLLTLQQVLDGVLPALKRYSEDNLATWREDELRSMVIADFDDAQIGRYVCDLLEQRFERIRVKDLRLPHALQVVGPANDVEALRAWIFSDRPGTRRHSTPIIRSDSAHADGYRYPGALAAFRSLPFGTADCDVYFHAGEPLRAGFVPVDPGGALFAAMMSPLSMGTVYKQLLRGPTQLVMLGSRRVSRFVFFGAPTRADSPIRHLHWESLLLGDKAELAVHRGERW
jgi:hypothetical protein